MFHFILTRIISFLTKKVFNTNWKGRWDVEGSVHHINRQPFAVNPFQFLDEV